MNDYLDLFISYLTVEKGLSANTRSAYSRDLARYLDFLEKSERQKPSDVGPADIAAFMATLQKRSIGPRSRARCLSAIRMFHKFLMIENYADSNPATIIEAPRTLHKLPQFLDGREVDALLAACLGERDEDLRDLAMLELLYATGLRVSELVNLKLREVNLDSGYLMTVGKGNKERLVPIGESARVRTTAYLDTVRLRVDPLRQNPYFFFPVWGSNEPPGFLEYHQEKGADGGSPEKHFTSHPATLFLRLICWKTARICAVYRSCWGMQIWPARRSIPTLPASGLNACINRFIPVDDTLHVVWRSFIDTFM